MRGVYLLRVALPIFSIFLNLKTGTLSVNKPQVEYECIVISTRGTTVWADTCLHLRYPTTRYPWCYVISAFHHLPVAYTGGRAMLGAIAEKSFQRVKTKVSPIVEMTSLCYSN